MILEHQFSVPAPLDEVWKAVLDPERVAPCMPGATLSGVDGDSFRGSVKVKLGPISLLYKGSGQFVEKDEQAHKVVIEASGKDARGAGTAAATVSVTLTANGATTDGAVHTDLNITGRPAQFGRGMISEVAGKLLDTFSQCLAEKLGGNPSGAAAEQAADHPKGAEASSGSGGAPVSGNASRPGNSTASKPGTAQEPPPIDLMEYAGSSVAKRLAPVIAGGLVALLVLLLRRRRKNR